jgi:hypothetical protein
VYIVAKLAGVTGANRIEFLVADKVPASGMLVAGAVDA